MEVEEAMEVVVEVEEAENSLVIHSMEELKEHDHFQGQNVRVKGPFQRLCVAQGLKKRLAYLEEKKGWVVDPPSSAKLEAVASVAATVQKGCEMLSQLVRLYKAENFKLLMEATRRLTLLDTLEQLGQDLKESKYRRRAIQDLGKVLERAAVVARDSAPKVVYKKLEKLKKKCVGIYNMEVNL